jgi:hypothetical protein
MIHPLPEWMAALDAHAPMVAATSCVVLLLTVFAAMLLIMKRRDMEALRKADESFVGVLQSASHLLSPYQDQQSFNGSPRWQIYLAACRELCFYLLGTDQVEKNFATRLRAAGRINTSQMAAVTRAMRLGVGECCLTLHSLSPGPFLSGLMMPFIGLLGSLLVVVSVLARKASADLGWSQVIEPASVPFLLSVFASFFLLILSRGLSQQIRIHEAQLHLFPLSLTNLMERAFVDHRQSLEELPSVVGLGSPHVPSLSLPPADQPRRTAV